jgi:hypothetical protein
MKNVFYLHYNEQELIERIASLQKAGYNIHSHFSTEKAAKFGEQLPDIFVLSLARLPSHAKAYAQWIWEAKKRQHLPIVFVDGVPEKVEPMQELFPKAIFCESKNLLSTLKKLS